MFDKISAMIAQLTTHEVEILDKIIPTPTFGDWNRLQHKLRDTISESEQNQPHAQGQRTGINGLTAIRNIQQFLIKEEFYGEREGMVFFLTEKGKELQHQRSLAQFYKWKEERATVVRQELHDIGERGYLEQDKIVHNEPRLGITYKTRKYIYYPVVAIIIIVLLVGYAHHNGYDKKFPALKNWLDKK